MTGTKLAQVLRENRFGGSTTDAHSKKKGRWKCAYLCFFLHKLWTYLSQISNFKQIAIYSQETCYQFLVNAFLQNLVSFSFKSTCFHKVWVYFSMSTKINDAENHITAFSVHLKLHFHLVVGWERFNKFDTCIWIEQIGDSWPFWSLPNKYVTWSKTSQSIISLLAPLLSPFPKTKKKNPNNVTFGKTD